MTFPWKKLAFAAWMLFATSLPQAVADEPAPPPRAADEGHRQGRFFQSPPLASPYYIGVALHRVSKPLRAHVELPEGVGLIVAYVFKESPATRAEIQRHDILLQADGHDLRRIGDLEEVVSDHARENNLTQFTLDIIRRGQRQTLWVTPAIRPVPPKVERPGFRELSREERKMLQRMRVREGRLNFDALRPIRPLSPPEVPFIPNGWIPDGVSISMQRENDGPTRITVQRGDETWEVEGDDAAALAELPEDLRPMVEKMLQGDGPERPDGLRDRLEQMEQQMRELREQFHEQPQ